MAIFKNSALVYSFFEWPVFPYLQRALPLPEAQLDHGCWIHARSAGDDSRIFEILPEPPLSKKVTTEGLVITRLMDDLYGPDLRGGLWPEDYVGTFHHGFHASEKLPRVREAFERDGFQITTLLEWQAQMYASFKLGAASDRREALGRRFTDGSLAPSTKLDAARAAAMRYVLDGGEAPKVAAKTFPEAWLELSLEVCVERWEAFDERLLDVVCANCRDPRTLRWLAPRSERGLDRHGMLRDKLLARGMSPGWVLSATLQSLLHWPSARLWVRSLASSLDEALGWVGALRPKAAQATTVNALFSAFHGYAALPLNTRAIKRWRAENPTHPLIDAAVAPLLKVYDPK